MEAGEILPAGEGLYYSRSYYKDTARSEERTIVATSDPADKGVYNNWHPAAEMKAKLTGLMTGASAGKTMYVIPYLMSPAGSPLEKYAAGVELTDNRSVVLHMIRMARVGVEFINNLADPDSFVRAVHVTGDLENLGQGTPEDKRYFVTVADERTILHFGSSYGGNALLGKIAHGLRQASYDGWASGKFLAEQFMLLGITDKQTGKKYHIAGGFPSASGKTNLAMMLSPDALGDRYYVEFYGDDIAWMWVGEDGRLYGMNPEFGVFGVAKDTNEKTNPTAIESIAPGTRAIFTNVAYNDEDAGGLVGGPHRRTRRRTSTAGWTGRATRSPTARAGGGGRPRGRTRTAGSPPPSPTCRTSASDYADPHGVPIDAIIFGGRTRDREPLIRAITDVAEGVYDGLTLGAEATFAADGARRPAPLRPDVDAPVHVLPGGPVRGALAEDHRRVPPSSRSSRTSTGSSATPEDGHFLWPGYRDNLRALLWLMQLQERRGVRRGDAGRHPAGQGRAQPRRPRDRPGRPRQAAHHRHRPLAAGDRLPRSSTWSSSPASPRRSGRPTAASPPPSTTTSGPLAAPRESRRSHNPIVLGIDLRAIPSLALVIWGHLREPTRARPTHPAGARTACFLVRCRAWCRSQRDAADAAVLGERRGPAA